MKIKSVLVIQCGLVSFRRVQTLQKPTLEVRESYCSIFVEHHVQNRHADYNRENENDEVLGFFSHFEDILNAVFLEICVLYDLEEPYSLDQ